MIIFPTLFLPPPLKKKNSTNIPQFTSNFFPWETTPPAQDLSHCGVWRCSIQDQKRKCADFGSWPKWPHFFAIGSLCAFLAGSSGKNMIAQLLACLHWRKCLPDTPMLSPNSSQQQNVPDRHRQLHSLGRGNTREGLDFKGRGNGMSFVDEVWCFQGSAGVRERGAEK